MNIKSVSDELDQAIMSRDYSRVLDFFHEDCEIEILNQVLHGKKGVEQWLDWLYSNAPEISFEPVVIISEGNVFYEEFYTNITLPNGKKIRSHQAETLIYEDNLLKTLRIFFNPLDFAGVVAKGKISKWIVSLFQKKAIEGLK